MKKLFCKIISFICIISLVLYKPLVAEAAITSIGTYQEFEYTGGVQSFTVPVTGLYRLEVYGAQGGSYSSGTGGKGGYARGYIALDKGTTIYIVVGGTGSYNGGGTTSGGSGSNGGGATHIATTNRGVLKNYSNYKSEILIVAGGGGGGAYAYNEPCYGGTGGGTTGGRATACDGSGGYGGSQTAGGAPTSSEGVAGSFGQGGSGYIAGGGGGYYGGGSGQVYFSGGGGGSGYIGGVPTITYNGATYSPDTLNGTMSGNGLARIALFAIEEIIGMCNNAKIFEMYLGDQPILYFKKAD